MEKTKVFAKSTQKRIARMTKICKVWSDRKVLNVTAEPEWNEYAKLYATLRAERLSIKF